MRPVPLLAHFSRFTENPDALQRLRRFILGLAIRGKLVKKESKDQPAVELLKQIQANANALISRRRATNSSDTIQEDEIPFTVSPEMVFARLATIARIEKGSVGIQKATPGQYPLVTLAKERATSAEYQFDGAAAIVPLISSTGHGHASLKRMHYQEGKFALGNILCAVIPFAPEIISARYLYEYLWAYKEPLLVAKMIGTANVSLTIGKIGETPIPIISPRSQACLHELMVLCDRLETAQEEREDKRDRLVAASLNRLSNGADEKSFREHVRFHLEHLPRLTVRQEHIWQLRRTILDLAVRGKLVGQDPKDEPVPDLIRRIQAEKGRARKTVQDRRNDLVQQSEDNHQRFELPVSWKWILFGDVASFSAGRTPSRHDSSFWNTGDYPWVSIADMQDGGTVVATKETVSKQARDQIFRAEPSPSGTMIMSFKLTIGKISKLGTAAYHNEAIISIRPYLPEMYDYLFLVLPQFARLGDTKDAIKGATLNRLSIANICLPLPPLAEQRRIVAKVDELMAICDKLEAQITAVQAESQRFLEAVLHEALNGAA